MDSILRLNGVATGPATKCSNGRLYFGLAVHPQKGTTVWVSCFAHPNLPGVLDIQKGSKIGLEGWDLGNEMNAKGETQKRLNVRALLELHAPLPKREPGNEPAKDWKEGEQQAPANHQQEGQA